MLNINDITRIYLGVQGENLARSNTIDMRPWLVEHPGGSVTIWHKRNGDAVPGPTGAVFDPEEGTITWSPSNTDTYVSGEGEAEIRLTIGTVTKKSRAVVTGVSPSVTLAGQPLGSDWQSYIDAVDQLRSAAVTAMEDAEDSALIAEGFAVGEQDGTPVDSESPYYENNAKYYSGEAADSATAAAGSATDAAESAGAAAGSATAAGNSATAASGSAATASAKALISEGYANGKQNGTPVSEGTYYHNNAEYFSGQASDSATAAEGSAGDAADSALAASGSAGEAADSATAASGSADTAAAKALVAEGYANGKQNGTPVGEGTYYHNNAEYFKGQAESSATAAAGSASEASGSANAANGSAGTAADKALVSEGYANGKQNGTPVGEGTYYHNNAEYFKGQAAGSATAAATSAGTAGDKALVAEGYANGKQNGTPVESGTYYHNNAEYFSGQASNSATAAAGSASTAGNKALVAEGYAVGEQNGTPVASGSPYYENNAKYYAEQAEEELESKADVVRVPDNTSGAIKTFSDGADGLPMALKVAVEPVQDFHGYDHPWPGGGGKNLLPLSLAKMKELNTSGTWNGNVYTHYNVSFTVGTDADGNVISIKVNGTNSSYASLAINKFNLPAGSYIGNGSPSGTSWSKYIDFRDNTGSHDYNDLGSGVSFTLSEESEVQVHIYIPTPGTSISNVMFYPMIRLATESDDTFEPYSNICPISGFTGVNVTRTGKNLVPLSGFSRGVLVWGADTDVDAIYSNNAYLSSQFIPVKPNTMMTIYSELGNIVRLHVADKNKKSVHFFGNEPKQGRSYSFSTGETGAYVRFSIGKDGNWYIPSDYGTKLKAQLEYGSVVSDYEPYKGEQYAITFPSEAGTVYGGKLTINQDGTGTLVVDRAITTLGALSWFHQVGNYGRYWSDSLASVIKRTNNEHCVWSDIYLARSDSDVQQKETHIYNNSEGLLKVYDSQYDEQSAEGAAAFKAARSSAQIVYTLATPIVYDISAPQIATLLGINNVWADTGDILSVDYPADTKLYINKQIAINARLLEMIITANHEDGMVATKAYSAGNLMIVNGKLYKASTSIANGATLTEGTNVTETTVAAEIAALG